MKSYSSDNKNSFAWYSIKDSNHGKMADKHKISRSQSFGLLNEIPLYRGTELGSGAYGTVYTVVDEYKNEYGVVKKQKNNNSGWDRILAEAKTIALVNKKAYVHEVVYVNGIESETYYYTFMDRLPTDLH